MTITFDEWLVTLGGSVSSEATELLRRIFDVYGPVSAERAEQIGREHQMALARVAVVLVGQDIAATTDEEVPPFEYRADEEGVWLAYRGQSATTPLAAVTQPEMTVEVAGFMQDEVMADVHEAWPECPQHRTGLYPSRAAYQAVWTCRVGSHVVATIGALRSRSS